MKRSLFASVLAASAVLGLGCGGPDLHAAPAAGTPGNQPAVETPSNLVPTAPSSTAANDSSSSSSNSPASMPAPAALTGSSPSTPEALPSSVPIAAPAPSGAAPEPSGAMPAAPPAGGNEATGTGLPPMAAASCVGVNDPSFNLDVERPRNDPPPRNAALPALFLVGDSTVKNHNVQQEGWGDLLDACFDSSRFQIINWAREGRSTRSFIEDGIWAKVLSQLTPADYVMLQFGHNDQSTTDTRGTLPGTGEEFQSVVSTTTMLSVDVHTYGFYLRQYASDVRATGAHLIYVTPVPRNYWTSETLMNNSQMAEYVGWMKEVAASEQLPLLDLNSAVVELYTGLGRSAVSAFFTSGDNTHTNLLGAARVATAVLGGIELLAGSDLSQFLMH